MDGGEQSWIEAGQTCKGLRIDPVGLAGVVVDGPELSGVSDQDVVAQLAQELADPARMGSDLQSDSGRCKAGELAAESSLCGGQACFLQQGALGVEDRHMRVAIS